MKMLALILFTAILAFDFVIAIFKNECKDVVLRGIMILVFIKLVEWF